MKPTRSGEGEEQRDDEGAVLKAESKVGTRECRVGRVLHD